MKSVYILYKEIDSGDCHFDTLIEVFSDKSSAEKICESLNKELSDYFSNLPEYPSDEILLQNDNKWDEMVDLHYSKVNYKLHNIKKYKVVEQTVL